MAVRVPMLVLLGAGACGGCEGLGRAVEIARIFPSACHSELILVFLAGVPVAFVHSCRSSSIVAVT